jgi:glycosyltransferase involved in cell wall biosynthesis
MGALPPTIGGVSIHVLRLAEFASREGLEVTVCDLYSKNLSKQDYPKGVSVIKGRGILGKLKLLVHLLSCPTVTHIHLSSGGKSLLLYGLTLLSAVFSRTIITIHSGSFPNEYQQMNGFRQYAIRRSLQRCGIVICVSDRIADTVYQMGIPKGKARVIPAFIPPLNVLDEISPLTSLDKPKICASGYAIPLYGWHTLIEAAAQVGNICNFHLAFYNEYEQPYFNELLAGIADRPNFHVYTDLTPSQFTQLLSSSDIFIRPTTTDGDSIALREALYLGKKVIASNAVCRPETCLLFETENAEDLAKQIESVVGNHTSKPIQSQSKTVHIDSVRAGDAIVSLYLID